MAARPLVTIFGVLLACSSSPQSDEGAVCFAAGDACTCAIEPPQPSASQVSACDTSFLPSTTCCATPGWPSNGNCSCVSSAIFCGIVPGYFQNPDGGLSEDGCVCSVGPESFMGAEQSMGATCYSNGTTTPGPGLGTCCMFPPSVAGSLGVPTCACAAGLHSCGNGGSPVTSCSAMNLPPTDTSCRGDTQVMKCK